MIESVLNEAERKITLLEEKIDYRFEDRQLAFDAITHSSYQNEHKGVVVSNERLEFLGDSVLSLITGELLYKTVREDEGSLTKIRAALVCEESLYEFAKQLDLGEYLLFGKGEAQDGRHRASTLADAVEAVLGAIYLDGGMTKAKKFIQPYIKEKLTAMKNSAAGFRDYKTLLQEIVQKNRGDKLSYEIVGEEGPAHDKLFICCVKINSNVMATASGHSKKAAEQSAAREALAIMGVEV